MAEKSSATSATVRAIGPSTGMSNQADALGQFGTRPAEGRRPTTLQKLAGLRRLPPRSDPSAIGSRPAASAAAAPPLRAAAGLGEIVGVARRAEHRVEGLRARAEFRRVGLADHDRACLAQPLDQDRIGVGNEVRDRCASRTWCARRASARDPCAPPAAPRADPGSAPRASAASTGAGVFARPLGQERHDGVDRGIQPLDLRDVRVHHFGRGQPPRDGSRLQAPTRT